MTWVNCNETNEYDSVCTLREGHPYEHNWVPKSVFYELVKRIPRTLPARLDKRKHDQNMKQNTRAAIPVADFKRFRELLDIVALSASPEYELTAALEELAGDLANVEALVKIVHSHAFVNNTPLKGVREAYDNVWKDGQ